MQKTAETPRAWRGREISDVTSGKFRGTVYGVRLGRESDETLLQAGDAAPLRLSGSHFSPAFEGSHSPTPLADLSSALMKIG